MCVLRSGQTQCTLQDLLARGAAEEVGAAHDVSDALSRIVDHDRQLICEQRISATDDEIACFCRDIADLRALQKILERSQPRRDTQAKSRRTVRCAHTVATPTGIE